MLKPFPVICHETTSLFPVPLFPFLFVSAFSFFHFVFLYLYLLCFLCLSPSLRGWWDECKHMCGVYDGLLTGRSYLLCSAPVVLWLQLTAWILDKRADIKEYRGEEQSSSLSIPPAARMHVNAVGGGKWHQKIPLTVSGPSWKTKAVLWQASLRQAVIPYFSPHIKPSPCFLLHIPLCLSFTRN